MLTFLQLHPMLTHRLSFDTGGLPENINVTVHNSNSVLLFSDSVEPY